MPKIADATFQGLAGTYTFQVYPIGTTFKPIGGVYAFTKRSVDAQGKGSHDLLYIGETGSFADRIPEHEKLPRVRAHGGNCICVHPDGSAVSRLNKETDLRTAIWTPCNDQ